MREAKVAEEGFNALNEKYENLVEAGVIDPTKVVRSALQNAASIASLLLTTEALVTEIPEEKPEAPAGGGTAAAAAWAGCTDGRLVSSAGPEAPRGSARRLFSRLGWPRGTLAAPFRTYLVTQGI